MASGEPTKSPEKTGAAPREWPDWQSCPPFRELIYRPVFLDDIRQAIQRTKRTLRGTVDGSRVPAILEPLHALYNEYSQARAIADVCYQMNRGSAFYVAERERYRSERKEVTALLWDVFDDILKNKKILPIMADAMGKMPLLNVHNWSAINHHYVEEQQSEEDELVKRIQDQGFFISKLSLLRTRDDWNPSAAMSVDYEFALSDLLAVRQELAEEQGFESFVELGYRRLGYLDFIPEEAEALHQHIAEWMVPPAVAVRTAASAAGQMDSRDLFRASLIPVPELSFAGELDEPQRMNQLLVSGLPADVPDFWLRLHELGYIQTFDWSETTARSKCYRLLTPPLPLIFANRSLTPETMADYLNVGGRAYGHLCNHNHSSFYFYQDVPLAVLRIWGKIMEFLGYRGAKTCFADEKQTRSWCFYHMKTQILELPLLALIDSFQMYLHRNPECGRKEWCDAWLQRVALFFPDLAADEEWLERQRYGWTDVLSTYKEPFSALSKAVAVICGMAIWDEARTKRKAALKKFDRFCARVQDDSCLRLLHKTGFPPPFERDTLKRLAFQTGYYLGY
jgi:hypothetical protein